MEKKQRELERSLKPRAGSPHHLRPRKSNAHLHSPPVPVVRHRTPQPPAAALLYPASLVEARREGASIQQGYGWRVSAHFILLLTSSNSGITKLKKKF